MFGRKWKKVSVTQISLTHCDPRNCSPPGFSVHGILQAGVLEWVARYEFNLGPVGFKSWQDVQLDSTSLQWGSSMHPCMYTHRDTHLGDIGKVRNHSGCHIWGQGVLLASSG